MTNTPSRTRGPSRGKPLRRLAIAATLAVAPAGLADHIPGHDPCDPTFPMPIPGPEFFNGGILFVTLIGPVEETLITGTTFDITYVSDGVTPASQIELEVTAMVDERSPSLIVTGADLGFGDGPGTFHGTLVTDAFDGVVWQAIFPHSIVDLQIGAVGGGIEGTGFFEDSFITFDVVPAPPCGATGACCRPDGTCVVIAQSTCESVGAVYQGDGTTCAGDPCAACTSDLDGDGATGINDLLALLAAWGPNAGHPADLDGDGLVGITDLLELLAAWGPCA